MNAKTEEKSILYAYVDESGSITKTNVSNNRYFVIAMLFTDDPSMVRRLFKKPISKLMKKNNVYKDAILLNKEIKGSSISEITKQPIFKHVTGHAAGHLEIGLVALDNDYATDKFVENHARAFNYMIQTYLDSYFRKHSTFFEGNGRIDFIIDEQNVATNAKYMLEEYLNQQLTLKNPVCDMFTVKYTDSKNEKLVQLADFVANSFYRNIEKKNLESRENVAMLKPYLCNKDIFDFSDNKDIELYLP